MKGQSSYPFSMLEAALTFMVLIAVIYGGQSFIMAFVEQETVDLRLDRISNAAAGLETYSEGYIGLELENHEVKVENNKIVLKFRDEEEESQDLTEITDYSNVMGPSDFTSVDVLCLEKTRNNLRVSEGC